MKSVAHRKILEERIKFRGHGNVRGTHRNTIEVTKASEISTRADCIIGVDASIACSDLSQDMKEHIRSCGSLVIELKVADETFRFFGRGIKDLPLTNKEELVLRRSEFLSDRTAAVCCEAAAIDIPRGMITKLRNPKTRGLLIIKAVNNVKAPPVMNTIVFET